MADQIHSPHVDFLMGGSWVTVPGVRSRYLQQPAGPPLSAIPCFPLVPYLAVSVAVGGVAVFFPYTPISDVLRGEGHAHTLSNTYTGLARSLWRLITAAAATVDAETSGQTPGSFSGGNVTCLASLIYLFICSCVCR